MRIETSEYCLLPNILTLSRLAAVPVLHLLFFFDRFVSFSVLYVLAGLTDLLDGYFARKKQMVTSVGQRLDSVADIAFGLSTAYFLFTRMSTLHAVNRTLVAVMVLLGVAYLATALIKFGRINLVHTNLFRVAGASVYVCFVVSFFFEPLLLTRLTLLLFCLSFIESIYIFLVYGEVDPDLRYFWQARKKRMGPYHTDGYPTARR